MGARAVLVLKDSLRTKNCGLGFCLRGLGLDLEERFQLLIMPE